MTQTTPARIIHSPNYTGPRLFGAPVGDFSFLQTLLITVASGFVAFFIATFLAIMAMLAVMIVSSRRPDFSLAYRWFGLPAGLVMIVVAGVYLGTLLVRRLRNKSAR